MAYPYPPLNIDPLAYEQAPQQQLPEEMAQDYQGMGQQQDQQIQQDQQHPLDQQMTDDEMNEIEMQRQDNGGYPQYKSGGRVKDYHAIAKKLRSFGRHGDTILAHINPEEARLLKKRGGAGTSNPKTGLPEYGFFDEITKPFRRVRKAIRKATPREVKQVAGPIAGAVLGNMFSPGLGGLIGGGLGGAIGPQDRKMGLFGGAAMGQMGLAGLNALGGGATGMGLSGLGSALSNLGGQNYISSLLASNFPQASSMFGPAASLPTFLTPWAAAASNRMGINAVGQAMDASALQGVADIAAATGNQSFLSQLMTPQNMLSMLGLGLSYGNRVSPEKQFKAQADANLYYQDQLDERRKKTLGDIYDKYRVHAPEVILPTYEPVRLSAYARGGKVKDSHNGRYLDGWTKGKDDKVPATIDNHTPALLSDGEYVIPAEIVSALGDWNNKAGARVLDRMVKKIRKHKGIPHTTPKAKNPLSYMMGA